MVARLVAALVSSSIGLGAGFCAPAFACSLAIQAWTSPPQGLSPAEERRFYARQEAKVTQQNAIEKVLAPYRTQKTLWESAEQVLIGQVKSVRPPTQPHGLKGSDAQEVDLIPVAWLKGRGSDEMLTIGPIWDECGLDNGWDVLWGKPGERFVVFIEPGPYRFGIQQAMRIESVVDPDVKGALAAAE